MMIYTNLLLKLIKSLQILPGIGPKSAQRLAFYLLQQGKNDALLLSQTLKNALNGIKHCSRCRIFTETETCSICMDYSRDQTKLCIVESLVDIISIEKTNNYKGIYFALMGHLSPIDGIGPKEIGITELTSLLKTYTEIKEIIIATNHTIEGEATAYYIFNVVNEIRQFTCTRLAYGIPFGGELEYIDSNTIIQAINRRVEII